MPAMGLGSASRTDGPRSDVVAIRADIAALEARLQRWVIGLAIAVTALFVTLGGTVVGFLAAEQREAREDFRSFQQTAAQDRRAFQEATRSLTDRKARTEERLDARIPVQTLTPRPE